MSLQRLLTKLVSAPALLTPATSTNIKGLAPLTRALSMMPDPEKEEVGVHPHHVCVQLDKEAKEILGQLRRQTMLRAVCAAAALAWLQA